MPLRRRSTQSAQGARELQEILLRWEKLPDCAIRVRLYIRSLLAEKREGSEAPRELKQPLRLPCTGAMVSAASVFTHWRGALVIQRAGALGVEGGRPRGQPLCPALQCSRF